jgi:hypothetical protein
VFVGVGTQECRQFADRTASQVRGDALSCIGMTALAAA